MLERTLKYIFFTLVLLHALVISWKLYSTHQGVYQKRQIPATARSFAIPHGSSMYEVLARLHELDLAPEPFYVRLALTRHDPMIIKKGKYILPEQASTYDLLQQFHLGRVELLKVTLPEGMDRWQVAEILAEAGPWGSQAQFLAAIEDPTPILGIDPEADSLEGYLFPETYFFAAEATIAEIVKALTDQFMERTEDLRKDLADQSLSMRQWVTFASLVEKESSVGDERPDIASVFHNRIKQGMLLQCDPTIIYSLKLENRYRGKIYKSDIRFDHPYNTYVSKGLPPGPIATPSLGSLEAVLDPSNTPYFYFVAKSDGRHYFSKTLREHNRAVRKYLRRGR